MTKEHSERQVKQAELVQEGKKLPGVAEALEVYSKASRGNAGPVVPVPKVRHATGGNTT